MGKLTATDHGLSPCALFDDGSNRFVRLGGFWPEAACPVLVFQDPSWDYPAEAEGATFYETAGVTGYPVTRHYLRFVGLGSAEPRPASSDVYMDDLELLFRRSRQEIFITIPSKLAFYKIMYSMQLADYMQLLDKEKNIVSEYPAKVPERLITLVAQSMSQ